MALSRRSARSWDGLVPPGAGRLYRPPGHGGHVGRAERLLEGGVGEERRPRQAAGQEVAAAEGDEEGVFV